MKYQLHDSQIDNLSIMQNKIVLSFSEGFWEIDINGKQISQKQNSKLVFNINNRCSIPIENFISIRVSKKKNVFKPIHLRKFMAFLKKSPFGVDMEYDCTFANRKMLQLY